jgi:hypothetical protein
MANRTDQTRDDPGARDQASIHKTDCALAIHEGTMPSPGYEPSVTALAMGRHENEWPCDFRKTTPDELNGF